MEQEKTENPTSRKLKEAKKQGWTPRSTEFSKSLFLLFAFGLFFSLFGFLEKRLEGLFAFSIHDWLEKDPVEMLSGVLGPLLLPLFLFFLSLFGIALMLPFLQGGIFFALHKKREKKSILSFYRFLTILIEIVMLTAVGYLIALLLLPEIKTALLSPAEIKLRLIFKGAFLFLFSSALFLLLLSLGDLFYSRWRFNQSMKMTKSELKEELKEEGHHHPIKEEMKH